MTYELAKQLKDAGFPQRTNDLEGSKWIDEENDIIVYCYDYHVGEDIDGFVYSPTLSELIEACGDRFVGLLRRLDVEYLATRWEAQGNGKYANAPTPEEAVANLWLVLNKK